MGLYNFQKRFVPLVLSGEKRHTIRAKRKHPAKVGETLHLYTGLRQKGAQLLMRTPCTKVEEIEIVPCHKARGGIRPAIILDGHPLDMDESERLAQADGFRSFPEMIRFWDGRLPFQGHIIHWKFPA